MMWETICKIRAWFECRKIPRGLCMCGEDVDRHGYSDNHSPVEAYDYHLSESLKWMMIGGRIE